MILIKQQNLQEPKVPDNRNNGAELIMSIIFGRELGTENRRPTRRASLSGHHASPLQSVARRRSG